MSDANPAIEAEGLTKSFGEMQALAGVDLSVEAGTVCGLLGPNGAGKSTVVRILATLTAPDGGWARVAGHDVGATPDLVRRHIGLVGQNAAVDEKISGGDNLRMFGRLQHLSERDTRRRADQLLEQFGLVDAARRVVSTYSGGMRRRLDLAVSLITAPSVLFLDEPTTGLDPRSRAEMWVAIRSLVSDGTTVLLTTQYLDEADQLADQLVIVDHGLVIDRGRPADLKGAIGNKQIELIVADLSRVPHAAEAVERALGTAPVVTPGSGRISCVAEGSTALISALRELDALGIEVDDVGLRQPTLDDVFMRLTGAPTESDPTNEGVAA
jgi:ABC-2 type transport system ATP-binding protein